MSSEINALSGTALGDYGHSIFKRDGFVCVYCGFDGNGFGNWRQLSVNHLRPAGSGGTDATDNLVTACNFCNSATSRMTFPADKSADEILKLKREHVSNRLKPFYEFWSHEVAPRITALTPAQGGTYLPNPLVLDIRTVEMTDDQLLQFCADNGDLQIELTAKRKLVVMPPTGSLTGWQENRLAARLDRWADQDGTGMAFGPSAGFTFPNGAILAPDASWVLTERWEALEEADQKRFAHLCPDFVAEVRSPSDSLAMAQAKMAEYVENGARLGWLIDPQQRRVYIYRPGSPVEVLEDPPTVSGDPVLPGFGLNLQEIW
jgi:Uma2 family endonuclease